VTTKTPFSHVTNLTPRERVPTLPGGGSTGQRLSEAAELLEADRLRGAAVDELVRRRAEVEWFVEGDFDRYCDAMRQPRAWWGCTSVCVVLLLRTKV
jgi:hypothetical protein